jgi:hypothetical protein
MNAVSRTGNIFEDVAIKAPVRLATTGANIVLSGLPVIDTVQTAAGDRVLVKDQTDQTLNGIYQAATGPWIRTVDAGKNTDFIAGTLVFVAAGAVNAGQMFAQSCADSPVVIGTSLIAFVNQSAIATAQQSATSTSSLTVGTGSKTLGTQSGKAFAAGQWVLIYDAVSAMLAQITSYAGGSLAVSATAASGSGTHADWTIVLTNSPAAAGLMPPVGTGNVTGPGSATAGHLATYADGTGKVLADSGIAAGTLASRSTLLYGDAGPGSIPQAALAPGAAPLPYVGAQPNDNLHLVNDITNPTRDADITQGRCRDDADITNLQLAATMMKRLDLGWAAGGNAGAPAGGCDTGTKGANQTWHQFLIGRLGLVVTAFSRTSNVATLTVAAHGGGIGGTVRALGIGSAMDAVAAITAVTTNTISYANSGPDIGLTSISAVADLFDILASQNYASPAMPGGWTAKQCLGSFLTDGSGNLRAMTQIGDRFMYVTPVIETVGSIPDTPTNFTITVPNGLRVFATIQSFSNGDGGVQTGVRIYSPDQADIAISPYDGSVSYGMYLITGSAQPRMSGTVDDCPTNISAQVRAIVLPASAFGMRTLGWRDPRRRLF